ncbi:MAG: hypothetical protein KC466_01820 [Myxococcales bacterium]|nr:hypothetical protein [Myxococcales bacterium]
MADGKKLQKKHDSILIHCDRHTLGFLKDRILEILAKTREEQFHVKPPDAPEVFEFRKSPDGVKVYLEVAKANYDDYTVCLKGGGPGEIRAVALAAWKDALLDITDRFRLDIDRETARAKRAEFEKMLDGIASDLVDGDA